MRIAIAQEWIAQRAGSEKVFEAIAELFPTADLFALTEDPAAGILPADPRTIQTSLLDTPFWRARRAVSLPLMPAAWRQLRRDTYDVVISSSHAFAKFFHTSSSEVNLSYTHAPLRYAWTPEIDGRGSSARFGTARAALRFIDSHSSKRIDHFATNSHAVAERLKTFYGRDSHVIYPPVDVDFYHIDPSVQRSERLLHFSRFVPYKRMETSLAAAGKLRAPIVVAGDGPMPDRQIRHLANKHLVKDLEIVRRPDDETVRHLYRTSAALLFPAVEDFGIIPVEAQACGLPVVAPGIGGTAETVTHRVSGIHTSGLDVGSFVQAVKALTEQRLEASEIRNNAERFSRKRFDENFLEWFESAIDTP